MRRWSFPVSYAIEMTDFIIIIIGIGIARSQHDYVLDIGCLSWYRSNPI